MLQNFPTLRNLRPAAGCAAAALLCVLACAPALAQDTMQATLTPVTAGFSAAGFGSNLEEITFSGSATIKSKLGRDPDLNKPVLDMLIDMKGVVGIGKTSGTRFPLTSQHTLTVPFLPNQTIKLVFPIAANSNAAMSAVRTGLATFAINTDPTTGAITSVSTTLATR